LINFKIILWHLVDARTIVALFFGCQIFLWQIT